MNHMKQHFQCSHTSCVIHNIDSIITGPLSISVLTASSAWPLVRARTDSQVIRQSARQSLHKFMYFKVWKTSVRALDLCECHSGYVHLSQQYHKRWATDQWERQCFYLAHFTNNTALNDYSLFMDTDWFVSRLVARQLHDKIAGLQCSSSHRLTASFRPLWPI